MVLPHPRPSEYLPGHDDHVRRQDDHASARKIQEPANEPRSASANPVRCYISASDADSSFVADLEKHLALLVRTSELVIWRWDGSVPASTDPRARLEMVCKADLVVGIATPDYLSSDECRLDAEHAARRAADERVGLVLVLARACDLNDPSLEGFKILPVNGRPVSTHQYPDEAFASIAKSLRAIVEDIRRTNNELLRNGTESDSGDEEAKTWAFLSTGGRTWLFSRLLAMLAWLIRPLRTALSSGPRPRVGRPMVEIFRRNGVPIFTYVEPQEAHRVRELLRVLGRGLIIEGPALIGKSTMVKKALGRRPFRWIDWCDRDSENAIRSVLSTAGLKGHLIIDNAHRMSTSLASDVARFMRVSADADRPKIKVTLIGISKHGRQLIREHRELSGRVDTITMEKRQPDHKIIELVERGESLANVRFRDKAGIVSAAGGSFYMAQELCYQLTLKQSLSVVPSRQRSVDVLVDDIQLEMTASLASSLGEPLLRFLEVDRSAATRRAYLALLWLLGSTRDLTVSGGRARSEYPDLVAAFDRVEAELVKMLSSDDALAEVLHFDSGMTSTRDPRLHYYLATLDWCKLDRGAELGVVFENQRLVFRPSIAPQVTTIPAHPLYDCLEYPISRPAAQTLRELLVGAYSEVDHIRTCARMAGVRLGQWKYGGGVELAWNSLLEIATRQQRLKALLEQVLGDPHVAAYHDGIRRCLDELQDEEPSVSA